MPKRRKGLDLSLGLVGVRVLWATQDDEARGEVKP